MSKTNYIAEIQKEFPGLKEGKEDDDDWGSEGFDFLKIQDHQKAEIKFKKLTQSQPNHHEGFEGLAYLYYEVGEKKKATWFMQKAIKIAKKFLEDDSIDIEVIEEMENNLRAIKTSKKLIKWWDKS